MNGLPYYKAYPRDFLEGTIGMSFEVKGAYRLILDLIYMQGGKLPDDARYISGNLGCSVRKWNAIRAELIERGKLHEFGEFLTAPILNVWRKEAAKSETRPAIPTHVQSAVRERDGEVCSYCGTTDGPFHLDHIMPWSRGGEHTVENLTVACASCNRAKGDKTPQEWGIIQ